ncbi:MAG: hypothetical protein RLO17_01740 [Cyclobacteriaceae bacterium]
MEFKEEIQEHKSIIIVEITGRFVFDEIARLGIRFRKKALEKNFSLIFDFRETIGELSVSDVQTYFANYIHPVDKRLSQVPIAYISNERDYSSFKLLQQIWDNQGVSVMIFKDLESGIKWFESTNKT